MVTKVRDNYFPKREKKNSGHNAYHKSPVTVLILNFRQLLATHDHKASLGLDRHAGSLGPSELGVTRFQDEVEPLYVISTVNLERVDLRNDAKLGD